MLFLIDHLEPESPEWILREYTHAIKRFSSLSNVTDSKIIIAGLDLNSVVNTLKKDNCEPEHIAAAEECIDSIKTSKKHAESIPTKIDIYVKETYKNIHDSRICILDENGEDDLSPEDSSKFDIFVFGGILGDEDSDVYQAQDRDKGASAMKLAFPKANIRKLGKKQMTADTAVLSAAHILVEKIPFDRLKFSDDPEVWFNKRESTVVPFRYLALDQSTESQSSKPMMANGMVDLLKRQMQDDFF